MDNANIYIILATMILLFSCSGDHLEELRQLDKIVQKHPQITQLTIRTKSRQKINFINVCDSSKAECRKNEINYMRVLDSIHLRMNDYNNLQEYFIKSQATNYYKHSRFSFYVKGGAFGDIRGLAIDHKPQEKLPTVVYLNGRYNLHLGNSLANDIYYFSN